MADANHELPAGRTERGGSETSIWKKEISFGRVPAAEPVAQPSAAEPPAPTPPAAVTEPAVAEPEPLVEEPVSAPELVAEPEPVAVEPAPVAPEPPPAGPVAAGEPARPVAPEPEPAVLAVPEPVAVEPAAPEQPVDPAPAEAPVIDLPAFQQPTIELQPPDLPAPSPAAAAPQAGPGFGPSEPAGDYGWLTDGLDDEPAAPAPPVTAPQAPAPLVPVPAPPEEPAEAPESPEPAAAAPEEKVPFWKKDISLSRKQAKAPKERKARAERPARVESKPFWKQDISLSRKQPKAPKAEPVPKEPSVPFWKRDLSFGKKKSAPPVPRNPHAPRVKVQPFWKKELSFGRSADAAKVAPVDRARKSRKGKKEVVVGLKIGASQLAAARVVNNGSPELAQVAREPLEEGIIVGGELRDPETLAAELSAFFARHRLPKRNVRLGIANNRIGVRTFEITGIDDPRQLANAIRFRAQETLPIPLEEAVLDFQVLSETTDEEGGTSRRVLLVVAYRELVDRYVAACRKAGLRLSGIDLEAFAMLRAVITPPPPGAPEPEAASVVVNVGHDRSTLAVSDGTICEFTRVLSWGGQSLSIAVARALDQTPSEVEPLKHALVFGGTATPPEGFTREQADAGSEAVARELQAFARELVSSLRFYQNQPGSLGIGQIVLTGGTSHMPGLAAELERLIGVAVRIGDPLGRVKVSRRFKDPEQIGSFAVAVGLGIDD